MADRQLRTSKKKNNFSEAKRDISPYESEDNQRSEPNDSSTLCQTPQEVPMSENTMFQFMTLWLEDSKQREAERIQERMEQREREERCLEEQ